jgi:hypothetical protein
MVYDMALENFSKINGVEEYFATKLDDQLCFDV